MHSELVLLSGINVIIHKMQFRTRLVDSAQSLASIPCPAPSRSVMNWLEIWPWPPLISTSLHRYACKPTTWLVCGSKHLHTAVNVVDAFVRLFFLSSVTWPPLLPSVTLSRTCNRSPITVSQLLQMQLLITLLSKLLWQTAGLSFLCDAAPVFLMLWTSVLNGLLKVISLIHVCSRLFK